jgi:hypothetical protein
MESILVNACNAASQRFGQLVSRRPTIFVAIALLVIVGILSTIVTIVVSRSIAATAAFAHIRKYGGHVNIDRCAPPWVYGVCGTEYFHGIDTIRKARVVIDIRRSVSPDDLAFLKRALDVTLQIDGPTLREWKGMSHLTGLRGLIIYPSLGDWPDSLVLERLKIIYVYCDADQKVCKALAQLSELEDVMLQGPAIVDECVLALSTLENLQTLSLRNSTLSDRGIQALSVMRNLHGLGLSGASVSDSAIPFLAQMERLEWVDLRDTFVSVEGYAQLKQLRPSLRVISGNSDEAKPVTVGAPEKRGRNCAPEE